MKGVAVRLAASLIRPLGDDSVTSVDGYAVGVHWAMSVKLRSDQGSWLLIKASTDTSKSALKLIAISTVIAFR